MNKFKVGDKIRYEWGVIPGIWVPAEVLKVYETTERYYYVVSSGATVPEKALIKTERDEKINS